MKTKNVVTNTTVEARRNPMVPLAEAIVHGGSGSIEASEARGQQELVHSNTLPSEMQKEDRDTLEAAGVVFGKVVGGDSLFIQCTLPEGWTKKPASHPMWSELLDEKGRKRASIFYKAAFYDRKARLDVETYYKVEVKLS